MAAGRYMALSQKGSKQEMAYGFFRKKPTPFNGINTQCITSIATYCRYSRLNKRRPGACPLRPVLILFLNQLVILAG